MADYFVIRYDEGGSRWKVVGIYNAVDAMDANGLAAIATRTSGKYASWLVSTAVVSTEVLQEITDSTVTTFYPVP
jgi:hypothetical protein